MPDFTDQTGRSLFISGIPRRIVSLVPSQTELLADLGLDREVIGITKFCIHPPAWFHSKERIGGTKQLHSGRIRELQPDLIIANKEENVKEQVEALAADLPVWVSDVNSLDDSFGMISALGAITGRKETADGLVTSIRQRFSEYRPSQPSRTVAYLIWRDPYMTVGGDTFIHAMLKEAGFQNVFGQKQRYPETNLEELKTMNPQVVFLSSEPYPFRQKHLEELQRELPCIRIHLADGEMFSWYGSRLKYAPEYFEKLWDDLMA